MDPALFLTIEGHLEVCPQCQEALERLARDSPQGSARLGRPPEIHGLEIGRELGRGGTGVVYEARQADLDRVVAVKFIGGGPGVGHRERKRWLREARAMAGVEHPNVVPIYQVGEQDGWLYLVLKRVAGGTLNDRLARPLEPEAAARLIEQAARGVEAVHLAGFLHLDLKPSNLLLDGPTAANWPEVTPLIADFGLARLQGGAGWTSLLGGSGSTSGTLMGGGTPQYMAPEQAGSDRNAVGPTADVYGLGSTLYHILTSRPPFLAATVVDTLIQVREREPVSPRALNAAVPRDLETICLKCLEKEPSRRYATAEALADDLLRFQHGQPVLARPVGALARGWRWCRRKPVLAGLSMLLALALIGGLSGIVYQWYQTDAARREAIANAAQAHQFLNELIEATPVTPVFDGYPEPPQTEPLRKAAKHCQEFLQNNPEDIRLRIALTKVYGSLGIRYGQQGQPAKQAAVYGLALDLWESPPPQLRAHPDHRYWLAAVRYWLGGFNIDEEQIAAAYKWFLLSDEIWEQLTEDQPDNREVLKMATLCRHDVKRIVNMEPLTDLCRPLLEALKPQLEQRLQQPPAAAHRVIRKRLALTCLALGDARARMSEPQGARVCWQQAADLYAALEANRQAPATAEEAFLLVLAGEAYSRLATGNPTDAYYVRSVAALERAGQKLAPLCQGSPESIWLYAAVQRVYCLLARCHTRAGRPDRAEQVFQDHLRPLITELEAKRPDPQLAMIAEITLCQLVHALTDAGLRPAAQSVARRAAQFTSDYIASPVHQPEIDYRMGVYAWELTRGLRELGDLPAALQQAEHACNLWASYWRAHPDGYSGGMQLAQAWMEVGKTQQELGRQDDAWKAFQEAASVNRRVLDHLPNVQLHRIYLEHCYDLLLDCGIRRGDWSGSAAVLHEREKLWPRDSGKLRKTALDYSTLADATTRTSKVLTPDVETLRRHLLAESDRCRRAADAPSGLIEK
jgi:tetratricopeptide (TPR) repeat protein